MRLFLCLIIALRTYCIAKSKACNAQADEYLGYPVYDDGYVVLLVVNFSESMIHILRFLHQQEKTQEVARLSLSTVRDCYNFILYTSPLSLTRQSNDGTFEIIWPEKVSFAIDDRETFNFREGDKLYFNIWYEDPDYREETIEE